MYSQKKKHFFSLSFLNVFFYWTRFILTKHKSDNNDNRTITIRKHINTSL